MSDSNTPPLWLQVPEPHDLVRRFGTAVDVPAFGGRLEVNWSPGERVTSFGGLVFFAAFFRWLKSTAEHLDEKTRRYVVRRCAFRKLLMPEQPLGAVIPLQNSHVRHD